MCTIASMEKSPQWSYIKEYGGCTGMASPRGKTDLFISKNLCLFALAMNRKKNTKQWWRWVKSTCCVR